MSLKYAQIPLGTLDFSHATDIPLAAFEEDVSISGIYLVGSATLDKHGSNFATLTVATSTEEVASLTTEDVSAGVKITAQTPTAFTLNHISVLEVGKNDVLFLTVDEDGSPADMTDCMIILSYRTGHGKGKS